MEVTPRKPTTQGVMPLIKGMLVGLTVFFFIASLYQLYYLHNRIADVPTISVNELFVDTHIRLSDDRNRIYLLELQARAILEQHSLERRYHQGNVLLMSRIWVNYLSFVTGMILCFVGASFILGRIQEPVSNIDADSKIIKLSIASASPGIILTTLGAVLIIVSILTNHRIAVQDASVYLQPYGNQPLSNMGLPSEHIEEIDDNNNGDTKQLDKLLN